MMGTIRNGAKHLRKEILQLWSAFSPVGSIEFFVVESDSQDKTVEIFNPLKSELPPFCFLSLEKL
jgi:hypothetical protein